MAGTIQKIAVIKKESIRGNRVRVKYKDQLWTFLLPDFSIVETKVKYIKPELFDPMNLVI